MMVAAALALVALIVAAGCSGSDGDAEASTTPPETAAPQPPPETRGASTNTGPAAAIQDDHIPVDPIETIPTRLDMVAATGAKVTRFDVFWADVAPNKPENPTDPNDPAYDFGRVDMVMTGFTERGITPIVSVYNTPAWAAGGKTVEGPINPNAPDPSAYAAFMEAMATSACSATGQARS